MMAINAGRRITVMSDDKSVVGPKKMRGLREGVCKERGDGGEIIE
jgi:hypothetical protein